MSTGGKTLYKKEYCKKLVDHMSRGLSYESFGGVIGVGRSTMYEWEGVHKEWKQAKAEAMERAQLFFEQRLIAKVSGQEIQGVDSKKIDTPCLIFALKTRFHKTYGEKQDITSNGESISIVYESTKKVENN